jgi:hypothetical protein
MSGDLGIYVFLFLLCVAVAIAWVLLPFILLLTNAHLRTLIREQERTNQLLDDRLPSLTRRTG